MPRVLLVNDFTSSDRSQGRSEANETPWSGKHAPVSRSREHGSEWGAPRDRVPMVGKAATRQERPAWSVCAASGQSLCVVVRR